MTLQGQEGKLFKPLAFNKTYAMAAAAGLAVTLVPVLMGYLIRGRIRAERDNPLNRGLMHGYRPILEAVLRYPKATLVLAGVLLLTAVVPMTKLGSEFMPAMNEGTLTTTQAQDASAAFNIPARDLAGAMGPTQYAERHPAHAPTCPASGNRQDQ